MTNFFHTHVHSHYSWLDAMTPVKELVSKAERYGHPGLAITDHGVMAGSFQLYKECKRRGILPFPGIEAYVVDDWQNKDAKRYHLTLIATTTAGYKYLVALTSMSHTEERYHYKPRIDVADMMELAAHDPIGAAGVACFTGCYFGLLMQHFEDVAAGVALVNTLRSIFPNTYVEFQHHNTEQEDGTTDTDVNDWLWQVSIASGTPPIITQDCHYTNRSQQKLHDRMKMLAYAATDVGDVGFPGDSYHLCTATWVEEHFRESGQGKIWEASQAAYTDLLDSNEVSIPTLDKYRYYVPETGVSTPMRKLRQWCKRVLDERIEDGTVTDADKYRKRLDYELEVIGELGFSQYFWLVGDYCQWMLDQGIYFRARGSANGSLVCWLTGIIPIDVDPVRWKLSFDRFLTLDRERPPDIDIDVEDRYRHLVIEHLHEIHDMCGIGTYGKLGVNDDGSGSIYESWITSRRRALPERKFASRYGKCKTMDDIERLEPRVARELHALGDMTIYRSPGVHAAGFVLSAEGHTIGDWLPTMWIPSSKTIVTQMTMEDVEDAGYVKIDLLGLRALATLHYAHDYIGDTSDPPLDERDVYTFMRKGRSETGIFQFEGYTAARGCRELKVRTIDDLILVNALYRPAARDSGFTDMFLRRRFGREPVSYPHDIFEEALEDTLGVPVYQEQALDALRVLGFDPVSTNKLLKMVKRSGAGSAARNAADLAAVREEFYDLCNDAGMADEESDESWQMVGAFSGYGFNRAHATAYSLLGYYLAYYKVIHPLEFHAALLRSVAGVAKIEKRYTVETRRCGIRILAPDVNVSGPAWTLDQRKKAIRKGLVSIKGVGFNAAEAVAMHRPYDTVDDIIARCEARAVTGGKSWAKDGSLNGVLAKLKDAGALRSVGVQP